MKQHFLWSSKLDDGPRIKTLPIELVCGVFVSQNLPVWPIFHRIFVGLFLFSRNPTVGKFTAGLYDRRLPVAATTGYSTDAQCNHYHQTKHSQLHRCCLS